jgi:hypothetical protein
MSLTESPFSESFGAVFEELTDGKTYDERPPRGPGEDLPTAMNRELDALDEDSFGQRVDEPYVDENAAEKRTRPVEFLARQRVDRPDVSLLDGANILGIVGDNKRILTPAFHMILSRAAVVNFRYTKGTEKPYFYTKEKTASAILVMDRNIFDESYSLHTYNELSTYTRSNLLQHIRKNRANKPIQFRYDYEKANKKSPTAQSLGLAVKFQHTLELDHLADPDYKRDGLTICLKEGAIFSNSAEREDIRDGLRPLLTWEQGRAFYIGVSGDVTDSRVLITTLCEHPHLIEEYFPNQNITARAIKSFGSDMLLLKRILRPGERTGLVEYIEKARESTIDNGLELLKPVTCFYHKRFKPFSFVRLEIPGFMRHADPDMCERAMQIALWQYELGGGLPMVLQAAAERSDLSRDRWILEQQLSAAFEKRQLGLVEFLDQ